MASSLHLALSRSRSSSRDYTWDYNWDHERGWRRFRPLRPGRGMYHDVKRRLPYYWSDIVDSFNYRVFAATIRMYFVNLLPALAFTLDMNHNTGGFYGVNEALFSSALAALVFSVLGAQPLTVVGITGLISLFNYTIYNIMKRHDVTLYPQMMVWVAIWAAITHWLTALFNFCDYMRFVTDFSSNSFALYVGTIYLIKGVEELSVNFYGDDPLNGFMACMVAILYTLTIYMLEKVRATTYFHPLARRLLSDYAYPFATIFWVGFSHIPGNLKRVHIETLPVGRAFYPTVDRGWLVPFWNLPVKWIFVALPIGMLLTLLFYYDHNVSSLTAQAKQFPLAKPAGFHWDFFLLGCTSIIAGIIGIPLPNGLVPQAPVHTDSLTNYTEEMRVIHTDEDGGTTLHRKRTYPSEVVEQRGSHFFMGLAIVGTMTRPFLVILHTMPRAVFSGVFFVVGWGSIEGNGIVKKLQFLATEHRFIDPGNPLLKVQRRRIALFLFFQISTVAACVAISQTLGAIGFPVLITAMIPFRWFVMPKIFTPEELSIMDALTANNPVVLSSLGGKPPIHEIPADDIPGNGTSSPGDDSEKSGQNPDTKVRDFVHGLVHRRKQGSNEDAEDEVDNV